MPPKKKKKKARKKGGDNVFDHFTQRQIAEFKEGFALMDHDKDGIIGESDLDWVHGHVNMAVDPGKIQSMLSDSPVNIKFTMLLTMFAERASGEQDDDDVVEKGFRNFANKDGKIDAAVLKNQLTTFADRFTPQEAQDAIEMFGADGGYLDVAKIIKMLTGPADEEEQAPEEEAE